MLFNQNNAKSFYNEFLTGNNHDVQGAALRRKYNGDLRNSSETGNKIEQAQVSKLTADNAELKANNDALKERLDKIEKMLEQKDA